MKLRQKARWVALSLLVSGISCAPASSGLKPVGSPDAQNACPGGRRTWNLEINDLRADRNDSERVRSLIQQSLSRSFPGCQWSAASAHPEAPVIAIEIHRFAADFDGSMFDAASEWTVAVRGPGGQTLTQFDAEARVSRPNYRGSNNEREALRTAFEQAFQRTVTGLRNLPEVP